MNKDIVDLILAGWSLIVMLSAALYFWVNPEDDAKFKANMYRLIQKYEISLLLIPAFVGLFFIYLQMYYSAIGYIVLLILPMMIAGPRKDEEFDNG